MPTLKRNPRLQDAYRFVGFRPRATIRGVFGDPKARVITLVRRSKKQSVAPAAKRIRGGTTEGSSGHAICPAATPASLSSSRCGAWCADVVAA
jgi:hypothetical protein